MAAPDGAGPACRAAATLEDTRAAIRVEGINVRFGVLGPLQVTAGVPAEVRGARTRAVLAILVSGVVKDLVVGSGICFAERGRHALPGQAGQWPLFAVTGLPP
jgi:hypothetical protein